VLDTLCARLGIPRSLFWGFAGLLIFMIGDGVELGYLAPYLGQKNIAESDIAVLFTVYGVTVAIGSWCAGALSNVWGPRRVMWLGAAIWVGPAIVAIFGAWLGVAGIIWIFAGLYALSAVLMLPLRDPPGLKDAARVPAAVPAH
jgi:predicted MFS family arabinose efflux permease